MDIALTRFLKNKSKALKRKIIPLHYQKRYMANLNSKSYNQSLLTNLYKNKSRSLLKNNKHLAEAYQKCRCELSSKEQQLAENDKNMNIILFSRSKLLEMAEFVKKVVSTMEETLSMLSSCSLTLSNPVKKDLTCYLEFKNKLKQLQSDPIKECDEIEETETSTIDQSTAEKRRPSNAYDAAKRNLSEFSVTTKSKFNSNKSLPIISHSLKRGICNQPTKSIENSQKESKLKVACSQDQNNQLGINKPKVYDTINSTTSKTTECNITQNRSLFSKSTSKNIPVSTAKNSENPIKLTGKLTLKNERTKTNIVKKETSSSHAMKSTVVIKQKEEIDTKSLFDSLIKDFAEVGETKVITETKDGEICTPKLIRVSNFQSAESLSNSNDKSSKNHTKLKNQGASNSSVYQKNPMQILSMQPTSTQQKSQIISKNLFSDTSTCLIKDNLEVAQPIPIVTNESSNISSPRRLKSRKSLRNSLSYAHAKPNQNLSVYKGNSKRKVRFSFSNSLDISILDIDINASRAQKRKSILKFPPIVEEDCVSDNQDLVQDSCSKVSEYNLAKGSFLNVVSTSPSNKKTEISVQHQLNMSHVKTEVHNIDSITHKNSIEKQVTVPMIDLVHSSMSNLESSFPDNANLGNSEQDKNKEKRRRSTVVSYKEPSLTKKMRRSE